MAQLITVRLSRDGGSPWGFRLQGGKDFGTPLVIQKVNGGSPAERAGLIAGDSVIKVNSTDVFNLRHKDAQDVIVRAGQSFELTVQRGGSTWKPAVTPVGNLPRSQPVSNNISPVTKTSLAAKNQDYTPIGSSHNVAAKGFAPAPHMNGDGPKLVNKQYNSPIGLYSEQSIAETLSAQSEVLSTGALGVNFKKNEKNYDAEKSEVFKMLQEAEREPRTPEPARHDIYSTMSHAIGGRATSPRPITPVKPQVRHDPAAKPANVTNETQGNPTCSECERLIVGVFVRIKDKNLHVECFKCATCGSSLKNVGYYNINNKLYCDIHAKLAARSNPPAPNLVPVTVPPGGRVPAGTISAALSSHSLPSPSPLSPSGNQVAAPFSPHCKQDSIERFSPNNVQNPQKVDAVANLMSALTLATKRELKENGTNTDPVFLTEKVIPINNNDNNGLKEEHFPSATVKYMPYRPKSGSSFSGPKPFSSVQPSIPSQAPYSSVQPSTPIAAPFSAPLSNTLPRSGSAATMPERKEWPPSKPDELPTASPLYIDPSSRNSTPQPKISSNPYPQPSQILVAQNPVTHYPISHNPQNQMPVPQIMISQNPPPTINETKMSKSQVEELSSDYKSTQEISNITKSFDRNMSICSAEFTNITGRRSVVECVETVSGAIDNQMLVNNVTKIKERPKSPPPLHRKDSVYDTQDISIVVSTKTPSEKNPTSEKPIITVDDKSNVNIKEVTHSSCNPGNPQVCTSNPGHNTCPMSNPDCAVKIVTCPRNNPTCSMNVQSTTNVQSTSNVQGMSKTSEMITSSKTITNPVPQGYISPMVKALTVASDRPFNTVSVEIKSVEYGTGQTAGEVVQTQTTSTSSTSMQAKQEVKARQEVRAVQETKQESRAMQESKAVQEIKSESSFPHSRAPIAASPLASALTVAPSKPFTPTSQITMDPVPLPPESTPYFPPEIPLTVEPKVQKQPVTCNSPFVQALTTAPDRPYTPLAGGQEQSDVPDFMKDVPAPSRQKMSMLSALTTASDRAFTPALSVGSIEDIHKPEPPKPQPKKVPPPPPMPVTVKPASHISPSAFRPIGNSTFRPVAQTYKPQAPEIPKVVTSFPPITDELKSSYTPSQGFGYSAPSKIATMQGTRTQSNTSQQAQQMSYVSSQQDMSQYSSQIQRQEDTQQARKQSLKSVSSGLQTPASLPGYQKNLSQKYPGQEQLFVPQIQAPIQPIQKPVTTLKPGQYQPNNHLQTFQPVNDENNRHYMRSSSPLPRAVSPSLINKPAPPLPYYQADLVAHECAAVETNLFDPRSPAISRSPSPCPGARSTSPFPRTMTKSPAQGPPPNPLMDRVPKQQPVVRNEKYLEAKQNLSTYIPKNQGRVEQVKSKLSVDQGGQSRQFSGQSQIMSGQSQVVRGQSQFVGGQAEIATQSQNYQNVQLVHNERQQQNQMYKMSEVENIRHMEQLNKSQMQSVETSADNRIQIQRTKRCTEEYERTQKEKTIEIQRTGSGQTYINQNVASVGGVGFQRQTSLIQSQRAPQKSFAPVANPRSNSLPGSSAGGPKPFKPSPLAATTPKAPGGSQSASRPNVPQPYAGAATGRQSGAIGVAPKRGRGILNLASAPGSRVPLCGHCNMHIRGPFITALGKIWCPEHFICTTPSCRRQLQDMGFVEEKGQLYCEYCFEQYLAPFCAKCNSKIKGDCLNAIGKHFHPECFTCAYCSKLFGNSPFFLEDGLPYCEADWNELFTTKCFACGFPVEAGDRWVEALNNNYHSQCFNCTMCKKNLEGQSFYAKGGRPFCKNHAR